MKKLIWKELLFASDHLPHFKKGDPTGSWISEDGNYIIEPVDANNYNLRAYNQKTLGETNYNVITGPLIVLMNIDINDLKNINN